MKVPAKKLPNGFELPVLGLGTWGMGGWSWERDTTNDKQHVGAIARAVEAGISLIDTAEMYGDGHTEELVGEAIKSVPRDSLVIETKIYPNHLARADVRRSAEGSLKRLGTDYLDLYVIHAPNPDVAIEETMAALNELCREGLVRNLGVSNFRTDRLQQAQAASDVPIVLNQVHYSLTVREPVAEGLFAYCGANDVFLQAWSPLKNVDLSNRALIEMAEKHGKTPAQVALNWLISQPAVTTLARMTDERHLSDNLGAVGWELPEEDIAHLGERFGSSNKSDQYNLE